MRFPRLSRFAACAGLVWALIVLLFLFFQNSQDSDVSRRLTALARSRLGAASEEMTNQVVRIPRESVNMVMDLAREERRRTEALMRALLLSAGVTAALSAFLFLSGKRDNGG